MTSLSVDRIEENLRGLVRSKRGAARREIRNHSLLVDLYCVRGEAKSHEVLKLEDSVRLVLTNVCMTLQPKQLGSAALALFGLIASTRGQPLTARRQVAGELMGYGGSRAWDAFRKRYEGEIIRQVADELYLMELDVIEHSRRRPADALEGELAAEEKQLELSDRDRGYVQIGTRHAYSISNEDLREHAIARWFEIEAIRSNVFNFRFHYQWSGHGQERRPVVISPGHSLLWGPVKMGSWSYCQVRFDRPLSAGERAIIKVEQELYDTDCEFRPFLSANVGHEGTEWLELEIMLPAQRLPSSIHFKAFDRIGGDANLVPGLSSTGSYTTDKESGTASILWRPKNLRMNYRYVIEWMYGDGYGVYPPT
jgi:hypothetical protein